MNPWRLAPPLEGAISFLMAFGMLWFFGSNALAPIASTLKIPLVGVEAGLAALSAQASYKLGRSAHWDRISDGFDEIAEG